MRRRPIRRDSWRRSNASNSRKRWPKNFQCKNEVIELKALLLNSEQQHAMALPH